MSGNSDSYLHLKELITQFLKDETLFPKICNLEDPLQTVYDYRLNKAMEDIILTYVKTRRKDSPNINVSEFVIDNIEYIIDSLISIDEHGYIKP